MSLIERLQAANKGLIGAKEHHDAIAEAIDLLNRIIPLMENARELLRKTDHEPRGV